MVLIADKTTNTQIHKYTNTQITHILIHSKMQIQTRIAARALGLPWLAPRMVLIADKITNTNTNTISSSHPEQIKLQTRIAWCWRWAV